MSITCFLPCRKGSQRVPRKNLRPLGGKPYGLLQIKLDQLLATRQIDRIVLSTDDEEIIEFAQNLDDERFQIHQRDDRLASSNTSTDNLVGHAADLIPQGHILWTHVTSPFVTAEDYDRIVARYRHALDEGYDSLMTVTELRGFLWDRHGPVNYDRTVEKWPRTQTLEPIYEVNSAAFLAPVEVYAEQLDRIGGRPYMYPLEKVQGFDIDWSEDFQMAEALLTAGVANI